MTTPTDSRLDAAALEQLRYPVGRETRQPEVTAADRARWIEEIAALPERLRAAVEGREDAWLDTPYRPGGWTRRQVVHHLADSHLNAYTRFMFALTEDEPRIKPYDEAAWARLLYPRTAPVQDTLTLLTGLHGRWAATLRGIEDSQWSRAIDHPERGRMTLDDLLQTYEWHCRHHLGHLRAGG